jgi:membrane protease YdiL (CAAX protease family)
MMITSAVFASLHAHWVGFLPILALGLLLVYLFEKTGSLVPSMVVHMMHNVGMVVLVFVVRSIGV